MEKKRPELCQITGAFPLCREACNSEEAHSIGRARSHFPWILSPRDQRFLLSHNRTRPGATRLLWGASALQCSNNTTRVPHFSDEKQPVKEYPAISATGQCPAAERRNGLIQTPGRTTNAAAGGGRGFRHHRRGSNDSDKLRQSSSSPLQAGPGWFFQSLLNR
jgi:hypothetical protein